jgi:hypothetical protein
MEPDFDMVFYTDGIAEILMTAFVDDDIIPIHVIWYHATQIAAIVIVAVGKGTLMLHTKIWVFHQGISIVPERVFAKKRSKQLNMGFTCSK